MSNPPKTGKTQMADIARIAGVSVSTVSRALAGSPLVRDDTKRRISELAKSLRFSANIGASNLRRGHSRTVAVVLPKSRENPQPVTDPFFISLVGELADALTSRGYDMLLTRVDEERIEDIDGLVDSGRALGIVVIGQWLRHHTLTGLAARGVPIAVWGAALPGSNYFIVGSDNRLGGELATQHLIACGRKKIMFLGDTRLPEVALRFEGYRDALIANGGMVNPGLTAAIPFEAKAARHALDDLFSHTSDFDALFACSDLMAITANALLSARGVRVPEAVSVVGYDDLALASQVHPTLTSVRQPLAEAAQALVDSVLAAREGKTPTMTVLKTTLVERESTKLVSPVRASAKTTKSARSKKRNRIDE
jgi:DNA-binding LacI/PurR family transcriptional regulator